MSQNPDPGEGRITTEDRGRILLMGIDRPAKLNGFTPEMSRQVGRRLHTP